MLLQYGGASSERALRRATLLLNYSYSIARKDTTKSPDAVIALLFLGVGGGGEFMDLLDACRNENTYSHFGGFSQVLWQAEWAAGNFQNPFTHLSSRPLCTGYSLCAV